MRRFYILTFNRQTDDKYMHIPVVKPSAPELAWRVKNCERSKRLLTNCFEVDFFLWKFLCHD